MMTTCAFGMTAPEESFTVPVSVAPETCAYAWPVPKILMAAIANTTTALVRFPKNSLCSIDIPPEARPGNFSHNSTELPMGL
jgi:hypothetical protein